MPDSLKDVLMQRLFPSTVPSRTGQAWAPPVPLKPPLQSESPKPALWRGLLEDVMEAQRRIGEAGESLLPDPFSTTPYDPEAALHALLGTSKPKLPGVKGDPEGYMAKTLQKATAVGDDPLAPDKMKLGMVPLVPGEGIIAYHGSPYDFSKFSLDKIKSGEGFNMYARGHYFAEKEPVAQRYKESTSLLRNAVKWLDRQTGEPLPVTPRQKLELDNFMRTYGYDLRYGDLENQANHFRDLAEQRRTIDIPGYMKAAQKAVNPADKAFLEGEIKDLHEDVDHFLRTADLFERARIEPQGHMYQVRIKATPESLLDWDKTLSAQSPRVQDAITKEFGPEWFQQHRELSGKPLYKALDIGSTKDAKGLPEQVLFPKKGLSKYTLLDPDSTKDAEGVIANARLLKQGIPGAQYLDAGSRRGGYGTRNFVVWDDSYIDILKKFGVALPVIEALRKKASAQGGMLAQDDLTQYQ